MKSGETLITASPAQPGDEADEARDAQLRTSVTGLFDLVCEILGGQQACPGAVLVNCLNAAEPAVAADLVLAYARNLAAERPGR
jgi:hypothetical protein